MSWLEKHGEGIYRLGVNTGHSFNEAIQTAHDSDLIFVIEPFSFTTTRSTKESADVTHATKR